MKSKLGAFLLCFFLGVFGVHRFYLGKIGTGILYLFTAGLFGIGAFVDLIKIANNSMTDKSGCSLNEDCPNVIPWIGVGLIVLIFVIGFFSGIASTASDVANSSVIEESYSPSTTKPAKKQEKATVKTYTAYNVTELFDDMDKNALKAEQKHQDEYVELTGYVSVIDSDGKYISIGARKDDYDYLLRSILCDITNDAQRQVVMDLERYDKVTVRGKITNIGEVMGYTLDMDSIEIVR